MWMVLGHVRMAPCVVFLPVLQLFLAPCQATHAMVMWWSPGDLDPVHALATAVRLAMRWWEADSNSVRTMDNGLGPSHHAEWCKTKQSLHVRHCVLVDLHSLHLMRKPLSGLEIRWSLASFGKADMLMQPANESGWRRRGIFYNITSSLPNAVWEELAIDLLGISPLIYCVHRS